MKSEENDEGGHCVFFVFTSWLQAYLICCVWNCYRYVSGRGTTEVLVYVTTNDTAVSVCIYLLAHHLKDITKTSLIHEMLMI